HPEIGKRSHNLKGPTRGLRIRPSVRLPREISASVQRPDSRTHTNVRCVGFNWVSRGRMSRFRASVRAGYALWRSFASASQELSAQLSSTLGVTIERK